MIVRILVACEESQAVTIELRRLGHEAYSCDLQDCSGGHPEWHIKADALEMIKLKWDMIIAHPPCTYLTAAGAVRLYNRDHTVKDEARFRKGLEAAAFFRAIMQADCPRIVIENPVPMKVWGLPAYDQIIEPFQFGDPWRKRTCLWLKNTPPCGQRKSSSRWACGSGVHRDNVMRLCTAGMNLKANATPGCGARLSPALPVQWLSNGPGNVRRNEHGGYTQNACWLGVLYADCMPERLPV